MSRLILYTTENGLTKVSLLLEEGIEWHSQLDIAELFQSTKQNVSKHIQAIYANGELEEAATVNHQLTVQKTRNPTDSGATCYTITVTNTKGGNYE